MPAERTWWRGVRWLILIGFLLRVAFALAARNTYPPDESMQYLEPAHRWVFGYGIEPWEYRYATRSWLVPFAVGVPLLVSKWLGLDSPSVYVPSVNILFAAISTVVIPLAYLAGRRLVSEACGRLAAVLACMWYELLYFGFRPMPEVLSAYLLLAALVVALGDGRARAPIWFALAAAGALALRLQLLPAVAVLTWAAGRRWTRRQWIEAAVTASMVALVAGAVDRLTWGVWFVSYIHSVRFNIEFGLNEIFGVSPPYWYLERFIYPSMGVLAAAGLWSLRWWRRLWLPIVTIAALLASHSAIGHKEYRFLFAIVPLLLVLAAAVTPRRFQWVAAAGMLALSLAGALNVLPRENRVHPHTPTFASNPVIDAYMRLAGDPAVRAVLLDDEGWTQGYYFLHRDVPLYRLPDVAAMQQESGRGPDAYASHIVSLGNVFPGFEPVERLGVVTVLRNVSGLSLRPLAAYTRRMPRPDVESRFSPTVRPFLREPR